MHRDVSPQNVLVSFEGEVKIIDFGIAKAAGKGSKTQAGILKGKFGYMSPEQVRGIPIDRRSDVFSCGIVLYELLTGERLFVGESDFSTLEKVRNVEILPPSTYNRRIPDELERIVLKALAKDPEDRYQNAIDLHDELQAFVYTAGEFYSRKDLAGWMKKTFGREIEEETAKLESYRQLKAPVEPPPARVAHGDVVETAGDAECARRSTQGMAAVGGTKPPPPPSARMSQQMPAISSQQAITAPTGKVGRREADSGNLAWDDDELETQIYDNPEDDPKHPAHQPQGQVEADEVDPAVGTAGDACARNGRGVSRSDADRQGPDLSSLVSTAKGWEPGPCRATALERHARIRPTLRERLGQRSDAWPAVERTAVAVRRADSEHPAIARDRGAGALGQPARADVRPDGVVRLRHARAQAAEEVQRRRLHRGRWRSGRRDRRDRHHLDDRR